MFNRHKHTWAEVERTATPPAAHFKTDGGYMTEAAHKELTKVVMGQTTILYQCQVCNNFHLVTMAGVKS